MIVERKNMSCKCLYIIIIITLLTGCGEYGDRIQNILSPDEVEDIEINCTHVFGIPLICGVKHERTITERVEIIVTEVVDIIVEVEVIREIVTEIIVTKFQTIYITTEPELHVIVSEVIEKVKELVPEENIKDVPLDEIVEEVANELLK